MEYYLCLTLLAVGLILIIKCGDYFVDAAIWLAEISHIPHFIIGATIVSFCTTLPELIVSCIAASEGHAEMAVGNAIGSVTANTGMILAITMMFAPFAINRKEYLLRNITLVLCTTVLFMLCISGVLNPYWALIMFIPLIVFMWDNIKQAKSQMVTPSKEMGKEHNEALDNAEEKTASEAEDNNPSMLATILKSLGGIVLVGLGIGALFGREYETSMLIQIIIALVVVLGAVLIPIVSMRCKAMAVRNPKFDIKLSDAFVNLVKLVVGIAGIVIGSNLLVEYGSEFATLLKVPEIIIAVTIVAIGTSLPELITTINSLVKKNSALGAGNIVGANIIDVCLILPLCAIIAAANGATGLLVTKQSLYLDFPFCIAILATAMIPPLVAKKFAKWQGFVCLGLYITYLVLCVLMGQGIIFA